MIDIRIGRSLLLVEVDLLMPFTPDFGGCKHAAGATLIAEGSLTSTMRSSSRYTWNTGNGATYAVRRSEQLITADWELQPQGWRHGTHQFPKTLQKSDGQPFR